MEKWIVVALAGSFVFASASGSCGGINVNAENIQDVQINTTTHPPLSVSTVKSFVQCIQRCFYIAACNRINFETSDKICNYFNITGIESTIETNETTWKALALSDVVWPMTPDMCSPNICTAGEVCVNHMSGPVCSDLFF